ncbi:MAG TPA: hypothetical protein DCL39_05610 [Alteromonas macleodii]|nr:hypothetical protein [Alteromonas macleodii]
MPIFPGPVSHNNPNAPIVNATGNQIVGFGFFDTTGERDELSSTLQVVGYLAIVGSTPFVYEGGGWTNASNWTEIGGGTGSGIDNVHEDTSPQLGGNLDVHYDGTTRSIINSNSGDDIQFTPTGTGRINLDGLVEFKQFDPSSPPTAFAGGMYADTDDNLYFGVSTE